MTNQAVLDKLQREIESNIDAHHRELDMLFNKLRHKVTSAFSGMAVSKQQQFQQRPLQNHLWVESTGEYESAPQVGFREYESAQQGVFDFCCMTEDQAEEVKLGFIEELDVRDTRVSGKEYVRSVVLHEPCAGPSDHQDLMKASSNVVPPHPGSQQNPKNLRRTKSELDRLELKGANHGEFTNRQLGQAHGEFEGRTNLWAFLQTKEWDSAHAQHPEEDVEDEIEHQVPSPLGPVLGKKLRSIIHSTVFDLIVGICILANSVVMGVTLEFEGIHSANAMGMKSDDSATDWPNAEDAFDALEHLFTIIYLVELILRVATDGCIYFHDKLNWMDFMIVVTAIVELYVIPLVGAETPDLKLIRLMRVFRIFRVLRMVRLLKLLPKLRALVLAVSSSIWSLVWSLLLLAIYIIFAAVFMTQSLQQYFRDETADLAQRQQVYQFFGNFTRSLITMFEITLAPGTWGRCGRVVIFSVNRYYALFFLAYLGFVSFAMIRVIAALFLKDTLASSAKASEVAMTETNKDPHYVKQIYNVFKVMDYDNDGQIQFSELQVAVKDAKICGQLEGLGVAPHEVLGLFTLMDDGDDEISFCEFITGIMRLKNIAKGVDLATLLYENKKLLKRVLAVGKEVTALKKFCYALSSPAV